MGSARVSRVGCGVPPQQSFLELRLRIRAWPIGKVRDPEDALASTRDACAPQIRGYAIFLRKRNAQRMKSKFDIRMSTRRFGQYSKKFAPRKMIARMSAMKYVVGNSAPSA